MADHLLSAFLKNMLIVGACLLSACSAEGVDQAGEYAVPRGAGDCVPAMLDTQSDAGFAEANICIDTGEAVLPLTVELAISRDEQKQGLMYRTSLVDDRGMLFPFLPPREVGFWMKNTLIPLDMVFIRADGVVESIIADVPPKTLETRRSQGKVGAVLELSAGTANAIGLQIGDRVIWP